jgi:hypothetical protein
VTIACEGNLNPGGEQRRNWRGDLKLEAWVSALDSFAHKVDSVLRFDWLVFSLPLWWRAEVGVLGARRPSPLTPLPAGEGNRIYKGTR